MRFVSPKTEEQQVHGASYCVPESLVRDRIETSNQIHCFLQEVGISLPVGPGVIKRLPSVLAEQRLPARLMVLLKRLHAYYKYLEQQIDEFEKEIALQLKEDDLGTRLMTVPGIGPITASLLSAELGDSRQYHCKRAFAASLELVPTQYSTSGSVTLLGISKRGTRQ
jgi:transposase